MITEKSPSCQLCGSHVYTGEKFCCHGCHAVYNVLAAKNALEKYQEHPIFQQAVRSGIISNPKLQENNLASPEWERLYLEIQEMWCPSCAELIHLLLCREKGVRLCRVDYATDVAVIEYAPRHITKSTIIKKIQSFGYLAAPFQDSAGKAVSFSLKLRFIIAAFCALNVMMFAYPIYASYFDHENLGYAHLFTWLSLGTSLPVVTYSAWPIWKRFWHGLRVQRFGMETLVAIGVLSAFFLSLYEMRQGSTRVYFDTLTVIIAFVLLGKILEARAKFSAKETLFRITRALPRRGRKRFSDGKEAFVPLKEIQPGDIVVAHTGEKIVLDGLVCEGNAACDESIMTGEVMPVSKTVGSSVVSGTILQSGWIAFQVTAAAEQSLLQRIVQLVDQDLLQKSSYVRLTDKIVRLFVPVVVLIAGVTALYTWWFHGSDEALTRAMATLLISCPCAIGIAAPLAESRLIHRLAEIGVLVRNRAALQWLGKETLFICDKTGTITEGRFKVIQGLELLSLEERRILKGLTSRSTHPISQAIANTIEESPLSLQEIVEVSGKGVLGYFEGKRCLLGSELLLEINAPPATYFSIDGKLVTTLFLGDLVREGSKEVIAKLPNPWLLSGDTPEAVSAVATACGFTNWQARKSPAEKRSLVDSFRQKGEIVAMLGDGINDAPALTRAHLGISVLSATDLSIQVSDILLTTDKLSVLPLMRLLAQKGRAIVRQNLFWAFAYNIIGIALAVTGLLSPLFAACAMVASSIMVTLNAQRL